MDKVIFLFPGQGSQYVGMGKKWFDSHSSARQLFEEASDELGFDLSGLVFDGPADKLTLTEYAQPAILTASKAAYDIFTEETGVVPVLMAGHSLGEFSALVCAGAIAFADAVKIVRQRGRFMQEAAGAGGGAMSAISGAPQEAVLRVCTELSEQGLSVVVSNYNSAEQLVISGTREAVARAGEELAQLGAAAIPLKVSAPFHSPLMQPAADRLRAELAQYAYRPLQCQVISNVTARAYSSHEEIIDMLSTQMTHPVRWVESMQEASSRGITAAVELGPQAVLRNLMRRNAPGVRAFAYDKEEDVKELGHIFGSSAPLSAEVSTPEGGVTILSRSLAIAVATKNWNDDAEEYEQGVVAPYRAAMKVYEELHRTGSPLREEHEKQALLMLQSVFQAKRTPRAEQEQRFEQLLEETGRKARWASFVTELLGVGGVMARG